MEVIIGFLIAATVGLTGMGGGSFTTPALVLIAGLSGAEAVGTAMIFAAVLRLAAAPFYLARKHVHLKYLSLLLIGAVPGLLLGTWLLHFMYVESWKSALLVIVGALLAFSSAITFLPRLRNPQFAQRRSRWLSLLALPIGIETGFSSAGAGALGTVLLLNFSEMPVAQVVGTDILFGIVLAFIGGAFHVLWGSIDSAVLWKLLVGGIPGVLVGCTLASKVPGHRLRSVIALIAIFLGLQLVWTGTRSLLHEGNRIAVNSQGNLSSQNLSRHRP
ncbi:MAG TPA: sulfite exporter TauE/SafE family protein [Terriglobales bacterium]|nr:sulfite exporter TauE/SafE family protein [Terriglobales bacterium]